MVVFLETLASEGISFFDNQITYGFLSIIVSPGLFDLAYNTT
ncbi:MAG: hypothetical protein OES14_06820 [Nitrosopumilus sp.]|nr:hypothetical protein [Nitrosopumilus sp.]